MGAGPLLETMRPGILSCLLLLAAGFDAAASDIYGTINRLRAGGGHCAVVKNLPRRDHKN